jgi:3,6-diketocamphane 1,6-monooxygenase
LARATFESCIEDAVEAEELGFDGLMTTEHHFNGWTMVPSPMVYLSAIARET